MLKKVISKFLCIIIIANFLVFLGGCNTNKTKYLTNPMAIVYKDNLPYILDTNGSLFDLSMYDTIIPYFDDILIVKKNNLFGYIQNTGKPITKIIYQEAYPFSENKAVVALDNKFYLINTSGDIIYTFEDGVSSQSSFSDNYLVIIKDNKQGYLKYNELDNSFDNLLKDNNFIFDYCSDFKKTSGSDYAVVGLLDANDNLKYTHIDYLGAYLYDDALHWWDYANNFSDGYAVVGNYQENYTVRIYCSDKNTFDNRTSTTTDTMLYQYVNTLGNFLGGINNTYALAKDFKDGIALVANLYYNVPKQLSSYDFSENRFFYNYDFIKSDGGHLFSTDLVINENNWGNGMLRFYNELFAFSGFYITTFAEASWSVKAVAIPPTSLGIVTLPFEDVQYLESTSNLPAWMDEYLDDFCYGAREASYVIDIISKPYNISEFKVLANFENKLIAKARVFNGIKDTCGLIALEVLNDETNNAKIVLSYLLPPLYDEIIF